MVSLVRSPNRSVGGGFSFAHDSSINADEDDIRPLHPVLGDDTETELFQPLQTIPAAFLQLILSIAFGGIAIAMGFLWPEERERCEPFYFLLYMQALFWAITMMLHFFLRSRHNHLRSVGYLDFYLDMLMLYRMPVYVTSLCNVLLLVVSTLMQQLYRELEVQCQPRSRLFTPVTYLGAIVLVETLVLCPCIISYIVRVRRFNRIQPPPDVQREEWLTSLSDEIYRRGEIGFRENGDQTEDLLERQADFIHYLREHNTQLGVKIIQLSARLNGEEDIIPRA